jgi:hypothetical protein
LFVGTAVKEVRPTLLTLSVNGAERWLKTTISGFSEAIQT